MWHTNCRVVVTVTAISILQGRRCDPDDASRTITPLGKPKPVSNRHGQNPMGRFASLAGLMMLALLAGAGFGEVDLRAQIAGAIAVYPENSSIEVGTSRQFSAYVPISPNTITWSVNDIPGGNLTVGTINGSGLYKAPSGAPMNNQVLVKATSTKYPTSFGIAKLTITRPYPWLWSVSPSKLKVGTYAVSFNGSNFAPDSQALANGMPVPTTFVSSTKLLINGVAGSAGTIQFSVKQPGPGAVTGNAVAVAVATAPVVVTVSPTSASLRLDSTLSFTASVTGSANPAVTWLVNGIAGGATDVGTISTTGIYRAPSTMPPSSTITIRATSVSSQTAFGQATITLVPPPPPITMAVSPATATVPLNSTRTFSATVSGSSNTAVTWSVNGTTGGSSTFGTISSSGVYAAPASLPSNASITVRATSVANPSAFAQAMVTLVLPPPPVTVTISPTATTVGLGGTQVFGAGVTGNSDPSVTWSVNGIVGGSSAVGTITSSGVYTAPATMPASNAVTIRATSVASPSSYAQASVTLTAPPPPTISLSSARFLEQSSFGPSPATLARVQQLGLPAYLDEQFGLPETAIPTPPDNSMGTLRQWTLYNYTSAPDQLRQRVAYALGQIIVTSGNKLIYANEILPWMKLLSRHAFGNYRDLLRDVTMSPSMGKYLDLANSMKPGLAGGANENYAREFMQLFTVGLWKLNQDGSQQLDGNGGPIPVYTQATVGQVALALTGWTYGTAPGATPRSANWEYFEAGMETREQNHDTSPKSFLGCSVPGGQTVLQDLDALLDCVMSHPNIAPFVATRLIRSLVMSNPSPGYIHRIADVFADNGAGVRGDLKAVVRAILLDPEARQDVPTSNGGRLKEPILQVAGVLRALNGQFSSGQQLSYLFDYMAQPILSPPSVFSWFSPLYRVPKSSLFGPEFQIYSPTEATLRGNLIYSILNYPTGDFTVDLSPFQKYGNDMVALVEAANQTFLYGRMPAAMKQVIVNAATPGYDAKSRIETVLYLTTLSGQYAVQH